MGAARLGPNWDDDWRKVKYLEWLTTPPGHREPSSREKLAAVLGIDARTMRGWAQDPRFREAWQARVTALLGSPERAQQVMDTLFVSATDPTNRNQVQAAKLYLEATNSIKPPVMEVTVKKTTELSDDELDALLAQGAAELKAAREQPDA